MFFQKSLSQTAEAIRNQSLSAETVLAQVYQQIDAYNAELNVFRSLLPKEEALARARTVDQRVRENKPVGQLAGLPISIKDNLCILDPYLQTGCASKILEGFRAPYDATVIQRLKEEDAIIIGTTNMDEFAMGSSNENSAYGATKNPWDLQRVPGGSSGGSAVSVATGMALASLGSDTGGSVRQPAAFCGVTGFKPSYGALSRYGLVAYGSSLDQIGCLTRSAEDSAFLFSILQTGDPRDSTSLQVPLNAVNPDLSLQGLRFCLPKEYMNSDQMDSAVLQSVTEMSEWLRSQGAIVEQRSLEFLPLLVPTYYVLSFAEASSNLGRFDGIRYGQRKLGEGLEGLYRQTREGGFGEEVKRRIMLGTFVLSAGYYDAYYGKANQVRAQIEKEVTELMAKFDFLIGPVSPGPAFRGGEKSADPLAMYLEDIYSVLSNLTRTPSLSIPAAPSPEGLPIGFQLMGKPLDDYRVLQVGAEIQKHTQYHLRVPPQLSRFS